MKPLNKILSILLSTIMILSLFTVIPVSADTVDDVIYIDENGDVQSISEVNELTTDSNIIRSGWYTVKSDLEFNERISIPGDVHLILCDGYTLTAHKGITVTTSNRATRSLTIYAQSTDSEEMGALVVDDVNSGDPGIGYVTFTYGNEGITINGGKITVTGGARGAGIGGGYSNDSIYSSGITINGGIVTATGGSEAAGIGGGYTAGCDVVINGGTVNATGGTRAAGIGGGRYNSANATVTITGGTVNATGTGGGAGIGSGAQGSGSIYPMDSDCNIKISGGNVTAKGGVTGAGIGGGSNSKGTIEITGGTIKAYRGSNENASGIGDGAGITGSAITLSWNDKENDNYYADNYGGKIILQKFFTDRISDIYTTGTVANNSVIDDKTIYPCEPTIKKIWEIGSNRTLRPDSVKMVLQIYKAPARNQPEEWTTAQTYTLNTESNWEASFEDFATDSKSYRARVRELNAEDQPAYAQGDPEYQEDEDDEDKRPIVTYPVNSEGKSYKLNYRVTYAIGSTGKITVTNEIDERKFKLEKKWDIDLENLDRPDSIQVMAQAKDGDKWTNDQIVTLSKDNDWKADLIVPKYRYNGDSKTKIEYRIRELKEESLYNQFMSGIKDLVVQGKSTYDEWKEKLKTEGQNVYNALPEDVRMALDDSYESLCETLGVADDKVNELYDKLMDILERESAGIRVVRDKKDSDKGEKEETNAVTYNVPEYESVVAGGKVDAHATKYKVTYDADGDDVTVTNLAIQEIDLYKHWFQLGEDQEKPDSAWLVLMCKPKTDGAVDNAKELAEAAGVDLGGILDYEFPVINPVEGGKNPLTILSEMTLGIDLNSILDLFGAGDLIPKLGIVKVTEDDKWTAKIVDKKYTCGIQMEYRGAELSGEIIRQIIKYLTNGMIDLPVSYNPFDNYITISTKAIPKLRWMSLDDFDLSDLIAKGKSISQEDLDNFKPQDLIFDKTALMTHIINVQIKINSDDPDDPDDDDDTTLEGKKIWEGDEEEKRPDWIKIHIKDGKDEIEGSPIQLNKSDFSGKNEWEWKLELDDKDNGATYLVSEEYPEDYPYKDNYTALTDGYQITNRWNDTPPENTTIAGQKVWKDDDNADGSRPDSITVNLLADGEKVSSVTVNADCEWKYFFPNRPVYKTENSEKIKIKYTVTEEPVEGYDVEYDGYDIINTLHTEPEPGVGKLTITATRPDSAKAKEQSFVYHVSGPDDTALTVAIVLEAGKTSNSVTIAQLPAGNYSVKEENTWSWRYSNGGTKTAAVSTETAEITFDHTLNRSEWLSGCSHHTD